MIRSGFRLLALCAVGLLASCETNHSALEKRPSPHTGGVGGVGGASAGFGPTAGTGGDKTSGGGHADDEPPGTSRLTLVNGVVDADAVLVCLGKVDDDGNVEPFGDPIAELDYAQSAALADLAGVDPAKDTVQPFVIAGDLARVAGLDCAAAIGLARSAEALAPGSAGSEGGAGGEASSAGAAGATPVTDGGAGAGGAGGAENAAGAAGSAEAGSTGGSAAPPVRAALRVRGLPAIPAGTLDQGRSLLLVANGCMGGATYDASYGVQYCGPGYSAQTPTLSAVLVSLSRVVSPNHVGLQVVHASLATGAITVQTIAPASLSAAGVSIASGLTIGQVGPRPAGVGNTVETLGVALKFSVQISSQSQVLFSERWANVLASGGLSELVDGHTYALVLNGPRSDLKAVKGFWNSAALTAIAVDPD